MTPVFVEDGDSEPLGVLGVLGVPFKDTDNPYSVIVLLTLLHNIVHIYKINSIFLNNII